MSTDRTYDAAIIGAGIHGAGVALAMASRGYSVLVLEQRGVASGTSSRSSKLIHGGLRYLESGQFTLVRECLRERAWLLRHAPDLVRLVPFHIPVYRNTRRRPWQIRVGLSLYASLTGLDSAVRFQSVPRRDWSNLDGLDDRDLVAVFRYWDAQTDDAALTRAVLAAAQNLGAVVHMPAEVLGAEISESGCVVNYRHAGREVQCNAGVLVNATGPWVNHVLASVTPRQTPVPMDLVQGTHIVLRGALNRGIYYVEAPQDGRAVFVMPWQGNTMVGTTEKAYHGDPAQVQPSAEEKDYLLATAGHYFPVYRGLGTSDIVSAFAGLRVLPSGEGAAFSRPRETILHCDNRRRPRLVSIYGGKLTAHRVTARRVVGLVERTLPARRVVVDDEELRLSPVDGV